MSQFETISVEHGIKVLRSTNEFLGGYTSESVNALKLSLSASVKHTPQEFTYDDRGSRLFDDFVDSEPYYLPKREIEILEATSDQIATLCGPVSIFEVGSGSGKKTATLLAAFSSQFGECHYYPMDINEAIMVQGAGNIKEMLPNVNITCIAGTYADIFADQLPDNGNKLLVFLGSSISQEKDDTLLRSFRASLNPGDFFLIAYDRLKDPNILCSAYDHPAAAALSGNVIRNLNRNFGADFDTSKFEFFVRFNPKLAACETGQKSLCRQNVSIAAIDKTITFEKGEVLRTGLQRKFDPAALHSRLEAIRFNPVQVFSDSQNWYSIGLYQAV